MLQSGFILFSIDFLRWELQWEKYGPPNAEHIMGILSWTLASPLKVSMLLQHTGREQTRLPVELSKKSNRPLAFNKTMYFFDSLSEGKRAIKITLVTQKTKPCVR